MKAFLCTPKYCKFNRHQNSSFIDIQEEEVVFSCEPYEQIWCGCQVLSKRSCHSNTLTSPQPRMFEVWWNLINFDTLIIFSREGIETWCHRELDLSLSLSVWTGTNKQPEFCFYWNLRVILLRYLMRNRSLRVTNCLSHYMAVLEADMSTGDTNLLAQYAFSLLKLIVTIDCVCPFVVVVFTYRIPFPNVIK